MQQRTGPRGPTAVSAAPTHVLRTPWRAVRAVLGRLPAALAILLLVPPPARAQELTFSVAISMKEAVEQLGRRFMETRAGVVIRYNFGASGELQKQIEAGAPVDLFISAAQRQMDELQRRGLILATTRRVFARNALTAIAPIDARLDLSRPADLLSARIQRIALGNPKTVPAGEYAEEMLRSLGLWGPLRSKLIFAENVRQVLEYVARGEVDVGFVYTTDAVVRGNRVKEVFRPPLDSYRPVTYPAAVVASSRHPALGRAFIDVLLGGEGQAVLSRLGFQPPLGAAP